MSDSSTSAQPGVDSASRAARGLRRPPAPEQVPGLGGILRFAVPLMLGLMTTALNGMIDTLFVGQLGTAQLAAVPLASMVYVAGWVLFAGVMRNALAFSGRAYGAGRLREIGPLLAQYHWPALLSLPVMLLYVQLWPVLSAAGHLPADVHTHASVYLNIRAWEMLFGMLVTLYGAFYQSTGNSRFPMAVAGTILLCNVALDYGLIFGNFGLPALGVAGSALATVLAQGMGATLIVGATYLAPSMRGRFALRLWARPNFPLLKDILRVGLPMGLGDMVDVGAWIGFLLIVGRLGETALAASNIGVQVTQLLFMPGFAVGIAGSSYMSRFLGAGRPQDARSTSLRTLAVGVGYMGALGVPLWFFGAAIAARFTHDAEVVRQAGWMFKVMAVYQMVDALGFITRTVLGGSGDTLVPMLALAGCVLVVMFPAAWGLSLLVQPPLVGAWLGASLYMACYAALMVWRFRSGRWAQVLLRPNTGATRGAA